MFDIGFSELLLIAVLALVVLGPKRLPEVARTAGRWAGRARRFVDSVKRDMDREMQDESLAAIRDAHKSIREARAELSQSASAVYEIIESGGNNTPESGASLTAPAPPADPSATHEPAREPGEPETHGERPRD